MNRIAKEWFARMDAEYCSAAITSNYVLWLIQAGASPDLIKDGLRIVDDEMVHAALSHQIYTEAGGIEVLALEQSKLGLSRLRDSIHEDLLRIGVRFFCLGETVAVRLFKRMCDSSQEESVKSALDQILIDEVRHRDFGWTLLEWLLAVMPSLRTYLVEILPTMLLALKSGYDVYLDDNEISEKERAWGLISNAEYSEIFDLCVERDYLSRFSKCGIQIDLTSLGVS